MKHTIATTNPRIRSFLAMLCCILVAIGSITVFDASRTDAASKKTPGTVSIKSLKASGTSKVTVKWKKAKNATSYRIAYKNGRSWITLADVSSKKSKYTHVSSDAAPLIGGKKYTYRVQAYNSKSGKWGKAKTKSITMPAVPTAVTLKNAKVSKNKVTITWQKAKNATAYRVYYKKAGTSKWKQIATASGKASKYVHKNSKKYPLKKGVSYTYMVRGYNKKSKQLGTCNNIVQVTIGAANTVTPATPVQPTQPTAPVQPVQPSTPAQPVKPTTPSQPAAPSRPSQPETSAPSKPSQPETSAPSQPSQPETSAPSQPSQPETSAPVQPSQPETPAQPETQPQDIKVSSIYVTGNTILTRVGQREKLDVTITPSNATNQKLNWSNSNTDVVSIDANGYVTAKKNGTAVITAMATDGSGVSGNCPVYVTITEGNKVQSITLSQSSATLTKKGQQIPLTATVSPADAKNKDLLWSSDNTSVAIVNSGIVTAVGNGTATITAAATDGSGAYATCRVTVKMSVEDTARTISIAGGKSERASISKTLWPEITDVSKITFDIGKNDDIIRGKIETRANGASFVFKGYKQGSVYITAKYNGTILCCWKVIVTNTWQDYYDYVTWRNQVLKQICPNGMSADAPEKIKTYIQTEFGYKQGYSDKFLIFRDKKCDCWGATDLFCDMAAALGYKVGYVAEGVVYDTFSDAISDHGSTATSSHIWSAIYTNGKWVYYDAQPQHS